VAKEGQEVWVKLLGFDDRGKTKLSMKIIDQNTSLELPRAGGEVEKTSLSERIPAATAATTAAHHGGIVVELVTSMSRPGELGRLFYCLAITALARVAFDAARQTFLMICVSRALFAPVYDISISPVPKPSHLRPNNQCMNGSPAL
jgi:hypothetical protein